MAAGYPSRYDHLRIHLGFDFEVCSDHFSPWLTSQRHAPNARALLGSGENLNEHVVGKGWPTIEPRQDTLREAINIIRELFAANLRRAHR